MRVKANGKTKVRFDWLAERRKVAESRKEVKSLLVGNGNSDQGRLQGRTTCVRAQQQRKEPGASTLKRLMRERGKQPLERLRQKLPQRLLRG